eukprot:7381496-Pyramimonas_sp.AAC.1
MSPHVAISMQLTGPSLDIPVHVRQTWKVFPTERPIGCLNHPIDLTWSWEPGDAPSMELEDAWK